MNRNPSFPLKVAVIGAGVRGTGLARKLSLPQIPAEVVAVAEPEPNRRQRFAAEFHLGSHAVFSTWQDFLESEIPCDAVVVATLDNQHTEPTVACLAKGLHVLLEKPLSDNYQDCLLIEKTQRETGKILAVCHSLRFMDGFKKVKDIIEARTIGEIVHIEHMEAIGHVRFAHNYVRGRWAKEENNTFLLLHKCCHDIDYLCWLIDEPCERVSSFGSLKYFTPDNAPPEASRRCVDCGIVDDCPYSAVRIYTEGALDQWPARDVCTVHTPEAHLEAIKSGPYGVCVWRADNDVVDHQTVMMEFSGGATATCTLSGYSAVNGRRLRIQGTEGELLFDETAGQIQVSRFFAEQELFDIPATTSYHPEDLDIVSNWTSSIVSSRSGEDIAVSAQEACRTHAVVFAAEQSRKQQRTIALSEL